MDQTSVLLRLCREFHEPNHSTMPPKHSPLPNSDIAIVGPGRVGQAMGRLLHEAGFRVRFIATRRKAAANRAIRFIGSGEPVPLTSPKLAQAQVLLLTTSDSALASVARDLAKLRNKWRGRVVLHTCGSLPPSVLAPFRRRGASVGSLHPFQTVPSPAAGLRNLKGCFWAIDGDTRARRVAGRWVKAFDGAAFKVRPGKKLLYHAAAFLVCPTVVTLMDGSLHLLKRAGVPAKMARPMLARFVAETVRNFGELNSRAALTGPAVRGDWPVIRGHLRALSRNFPELVPVYKELLVSMLRLAGRRPPRDLARELDS
jgi:predicted short-subunit dehydrogenase-like oxidoreductase (DUF2520 family)